MNPAFSPGKNIAMKIPRHQFEETVAFYRDVLQLPQLDSHGGSIGFDYDGKDLWLDSVDTASHVELWLEVRAENLDEAAAHFEKHDVIRRD